MRFLLIVFVAACAQLISAQKNPNFAEGRSTMVHLMEWKWNDIGTECVSYLGPKGFGGVQISPPNENLKVVYRPWQERYQPVSYILQSRSGDELELEKMIKQCNDVGVRIYADVVINHMAGQDGFGTAGSISDATNKNYPGVPYTKEDFHDTCYVLNYQNIEKVRNCEISGQRDLNHTRESVRQKIQDYMNHLLKLGVAGFRIDSAKHMWPSDLKAIYSGLQDTIFGTKPYIYQEVVDLGAEAIRKFEYVDLGNVCEFMYGLKLGILFQGRGELKTLEKWGPDMGLVQSGDATVFIDNHNNQRDESEDILTYKNVKEYIQATAFMLAHPYGTPRVMSSFMFDNRDKPAPQDIKHRLISPKFNDKGICINGWVCEHRWSKIANMVQFRNAVLGTEIKNWWSTDYQQIAFSRGDKGFIVFSLFRDINQEIPTSLPDGSYCDVITGEIKDNECTGVIVKVSDGKALVQLDAKANGVLAVHVGVKLK